MYANTGGHTAVCSGSSLKFDSLETKNEYSLAQLALMNGGFYTKLIGKKWTELILGGLIDEAEKARYEQFAAAAGGGTVSLTIDSAAYSGCVLISSDIRSEPDSRLCRFSLKFRRY